MTPDRHPPRPHLAGRISQAWLRRRQPGWERLRALGAQLRRGGTRALGSGEIREFGRCYQQAATDLAALRQDPGAGVYAAALNGLLAQSHGLLYAAPRRRARQSWHFYRETYPRVFRACRGPIALSAAIFLLAAAAGVALTRRQPGFFAVVAPAPVRAAIRHHRMWTTPVLAVSPAASSGIMTNNLSVAFAAFGLGITAGLGTIYLLFFNGLLVGAIGAACGAAGMSWQLWSFVAPHGVLELPAICIAGGAGLRLAQGLIFPGPRRRAVALAQAGAEALRLLLGTIPLLVVAGVIEGFISARPWPLAIKFGLAAVLGAALAAWLAGLLAAPAQPGQVPPSARRGPA